jgi:hypothetical protein
LGGGTSALAPTLFDAKERDTAFGEPLSASLGTRSEAVRSILSPQGGQIVPDAAPPGLIAVDGKTIHGSADTAAVNTEERSKCKLWPWWLRCARWVARPAIWNGAIHLLVLHDTRNSGESRSGALGDREQASLDTRVNFGEDACMVKKDNVPETLSLIRRVVINMLSLDTTQPSFTKKKLSKRQKRKFGNWDKDIMLSILGIQA